jgi:hypothetical protein
MAGPDGFEPPTPGFEDQHSSTELRTVIGGRRRSRTPPASLQDLVFKTSRRPSQLHHLPCLVPPLGFEPRKLHLLREAALPICPQGSGAAGGTRTHRIRILNPARMPIPSLPRNGGQPRTRTERHFVLSEVGIPIPFNCPFSSAKFQ